MKSIIGFNNYTISHCGIITNIKTNKKLKSYKDTKGYLMVKLYNGIDKKPKPFRVHILVALHFKDSNFLKLGLKVNHIDGNKLNNHVDNLEIVTQKENIVHAHTNNLAKYKYNKILQYDKFSGELINTFNTIKEIADFFEVNSSSVSKGLSKGEYKGFVWRKIENL